MRHLSLALLLCGCVTVPMARPDLDQRAKLAPPPATAAAVHVYRPTSLFGTAVAVHVVLDGRWVATLGPGHFVTLLVRPGEHALAAKASAPTERTIVAAAGTSSFFRVGLSPRLSGGPVPDLEPVNDEAAARAELADCSLVADPVAERLRNAAESIGKVNRPGKDAAALAAVATATLDGLAGPDLPASPDLDTAALRLRAAKPGLDEAQVVRAGIKSMVDSVRQPPASPLLVSPGAPLLERGLGLYLRPTPAGPLVVGVIPGSPAAVSGLTSGLELRELQGLPLRGGAVDPRALAAASADGSDEVRLSVGRPGEPSREVTLRRAVDEAGLVECSLIGGRVLYLRPHDLVPAAARRIRDYGRAFGATPPSVLLDLRGLDGGQPDGAAELGDTFIAAGATVVIRGARDPAGNKTFLAAAGTSSLEQVRLVALVDGATMGAAEAVAAAIQDQRRGQLRGEKTRGGDEVSLGWRFGRYETSIPAAELARPTGHPLRPGVTPEVHDDGLAPGPEIPAGAACPGDAVPGALPDDPAIQRAAAALLLGR